jgi:hypothetical protein
VTFKDGNVVLGTVPVGSSGKVTLTTSFATTGGHTITAVYSGDANFLGGSQALTEQVNSTATPWVTTTSLLASASPIVAGQTVTFTATVRDTAGISTPTGTVTFKDGSVILGTVTVGAGGKATFTTSFAVAGGHIITAVYTGNSNFTGSAHAIIEQVNPSNHKATTASLLASANPIVVTQIERVN